MSVGAIASHRLEIHQTLPFTEMEAAPKSVASAMTAERHAALPENEFAEPAPFFPGMSWYIPVKRWGEALCAVVLLVLSSPLIVAGALLVKLTSRGPAFYRQVRVGKDGRHFTLYKLRTMRNDAEKGTGPVWSTENDPRITPLGHLLRRTHIDEFPQLVNVALGQMSLVGPRPERPEFVKKLDWEIPWYTERLQVRPGITGLAQMRLPADASLDCVRRKLVCDLYYVRYISPWLDFKLLCLTAFRLVKEVFRFCRRCVVIPNHADIEQGYHRALGLTMDDAPHTPVSLESLSSSTPAARSRLVEIR